MILLAQGDGGTSQVLPSNDPRIETGPTVFSAAVIVFAGMNAKTGYETVRGHHAGGGLAGVDFRALVGGLAPAGDVRIVVVTGTLHESDDAKEANERTTREAMARAGLSAARVEWFHAVPGAAFNRFAQRVA